jgi:hypothetical protein
VKSCSDECCMVTWCTSFLHYLFSDDGTFYFDEKHVDTTEYKGPITTSASVVRGVTSFAAVVSGKLNVSIFFTPGTCYVFTKFIHKHLSYVTILKCTDPC